MSQKSKKADSGTSKSTMTEYDYYETLRLERKEKKVKTISSYSTFNDVIDLKDYFDKDGFLRKREFYLSDMMGENIYVWKELNSIEYDNIGNMIGIEVIYNEDNVVSNQIPFKIKPSDFYDIGFGENLVDRVKYIFDEKNNLIEKRSYGEDLEGPDIAYSIESFQYENNKLIESKSATYGSDIVSITKYSYNKNGLLMAVNVSFDFQNGGRNYGERYEYEFFGSEYDSQTNIDNLFADFFSIFRNAISNHNKAVLETLTSWSENNGGAFSINVKSKSDFIKNVYDKLFDDFWKNAISKVEINKLIESQYGQISLLKIDPVTFGYSSNEDLYVLDNCGNELLFKKINNEFKIIALMYTDEGD
ncbi:MAG: hypothetical protein WAT71_18420 [Ignavibacteria bacterium]